MNPITQTSKEDSSSMDDVPKLRYHSRANYFRSCKVVINSSELSIDKLNMEFTFEECLLVAR